MIEDLPVADQSLVGGQLHAGKYLAIVGLELEREDSCI